MWGAAAWVAGETLRLVFPFGGFPWGTVAFTQPDGPLLPIAAVLGEAGLSFATVLAGFALAELIPRLIGIRSSRPLARAYVVGIVATFVMLLRSRSWAACPDARP